MVPKQVFLSMKQKDVILQNYGTDLFNVHADGNTDMTVRSDNIVTQVPKASRAAESYITESDTFRVAI